MWRWLKQSDPSSSLCRGVGAPFRIRERPSANINTRTRSLGKFRRDLTVYVLHQKVDKVPLSTSSSAMAFFSSRTSLPRSNTPPQTSSAADNDCPGPSRPSGFQPPRYSMDGVSLVDPNEDLPPAPPRYSMIVQHRRSSNDTQTRRNPTPSPSETKHEYHISHKNKVWAILTVFSRPSILTHAFPRFYGNDPVSGTVDLNLDSPQTINSITISLRGRVKTGSSREGSYTFLDQSILVWSRHSGDIRHSSAASGQKFDGKSSGTYSWPFTVPFPKEVAMAGHDEVFPIPQTFLERGVDASVQYELILRVAHGVLRRDSKLALFTSPI